MTAIRARFPPYNLSTADGRKALTRELNEAAARHAIDYPGRFGLYTSLPLPSIDDCLEEIEYGFAVLGDDGVAISTSIDGKWLGEAYFEPMWDEPKKRKAVVYTNPYKPASCRGAVREIPAYIIENYNDTQRTTGAPKQQ